MSGSVSWPFVMVSRKPLIPLVKTGRQNRMPTTAWIWNACVSVRPIAVPVNTLRRGTNKSDFCTREVGEAKEGRDARVAGLGAAL